VLNIAGVAEWVDALDLKSVRRGFGKPIREAESPFLFTLLWFQRVGLNDATMWLFVPLLDTSMDTTSASRMPYLPRARETCRSRFVALASRSTRSSLFSARPAVAMAWKPRQMTPASHGTLP
jgi:hypothetical protein